MRSSPSPVTKMSNYLSDQSLAATYSKGHHDDGYDSSGYGYGGYGGYGHGGGGGGCVVSAEQWLGAVLIAGAGVAIAAAAFGALYIQLTSGKRKRRMIEGGNSRASGSGGQLRPVSG